MSTPSDGLYVVSLGMHCSYTCHPLPFIYRTSSISAKYKRVKRFVQRNVPVV